MHGFACPLFLDRHSDELTGINVHIRRRATMRNGGIARVSVPDPLPTTLLASHPSANYMRSDLLIECVSHTDTRSNIDPLVELLGQNIAGHVHANDRA